MLTEDLLKQLNSLVKKTDPKVLANYLLRESISYVEFI